MRTYNAPKTIKIENRVVGEGGKCFIIGEIGSNHNRDKNVVRDLIDAAAEAKFDAVKFQVYDPEEAFSASVTTADVGLESHVWQKSLVWEIAPRPHPDAQRVVRGDVCLCQEK